MPSENPAAALGRRPYRLAVLASHVIQYQGPLFQILAQHPEIELTVFFCSRQGIQSYRDQGFGQQVKWDVPLLDGYRSHFLPNWSPMPNPSTFWGLINPAIVRLLKPADFDAVWVHGWAHFTIRLALLTAFARRIPVLMRAENNLLSPVARWKSGIKRVILRKLFQRVAGFLAIGSHNADFYRAFGVPESRIFLVPYAVNNNFFISQSVGDKARIKSELGIASDAAVILFSGKLVSAKRPLDLLRAFQGIAGGHRASLIYLGDGPLRSSLQKYVADQALSHVHFAGFRNQTELARFFAVADIFVLTSELERWGLVVNEAMCFGLPIIASDQVGAGGDLVREGENGFVYPVGNIPVLTERITRLIENPALRAAMGKKSRAMIQNWSYAQDVEGIVACLNHLSRRSDQSLATRPEPASDSADPELEP
jgi:glycosyltransferase involved in cell wall biosynthesis